MLREETIQIDDTKQQEGKLYVYESEEQESEAKAVSHLFSH